MSLGQWPLAAALLRFILLSITLFHIPGVAAIRLLQSTSLNSCMQNSSFTTSLFVVTFTPDNKTLTFDINGYSLISAKVVLDFQVLAYGYSAYRNTIDPCSAGNTELGGLCPMPAAPVTIFGNSPLPKSTVNEVPNAIYYIPDLDGKVIVWINETGTRIPLACVEAELGNGKSVRQKGVSWGIAIVVLLGLILSAILSGGGHSSTATHLASNALSLFGYFQALAFIGMTAVTTPPIVRAWTQNFQWSMGIIRVGFLQRMATWYLRSTGGVPTTFLSGLATTSVQIAKRALYRRSNSQAELGANVQHDVVKGIERVGFVSNIEISNIFFTSYVFFCIFILITIFGVIVFKYVLEALVKIGRMKQERFQDFRSGWTVMLKGILFRIVLITFPQMIVLGFWEMTRRDSAAEAALAVSTVLIVLVLLAWASYNVWHRARRSISLHHNPAYILFSDLYCLNKWGFLYVQFKASMYFFIIPLLLHTLAKGLFIAFGQGSADTQAIALVVLELTLLVGICVMRPYMSKVTNGFNISIAAVNLFNVILLLFFTGIFGVPALAIGIMGVLFFVVNAIFALIILIIVIWASVSAILSKNPDVRYQPMRDDRGSFIKSQNNLSPELDALGVTARGEGTHSQMAMANQGGDLEKVGHVRRGGRMPIDDDGFETGTNETLVGDRDSRGALGAMAKGPGRGGNGYVSPMRSLTSLRNESPIPSPHNQWKTSGAY